MTKRIPFLAIIAALILFVVAVACSVEFQQDAAHDATLDASAAHSAETAAVGTVQDLDLATLPDENLIVNPGFEAGTVMHNGGPVAEGWTNFYCDVPYTKERCLAPMQSHQPGLYMGLAEWKISRVLNRVHSGLQAQQWFGAARVVDGGIYQTINTVPNSDCVFSAWVQTWSANEDKGRVYWNGYSGRWELSADAYSSDIATPDDRANSVWLLGYAPGEDVYAFGPGINWTAYGYDSGHYDHYVRIETPFTATSEQTTIFIRNSRLWPLGHNDSYVDDIEVTCIHEETPTPTSVSTATPTETPTMDAATAQPTAGVCPTQVPCEPVIIVVTATPAPTATAVPVETETPYPEATPTPVGSQMPPPAATPLGGDQYPRYGQGNEMYRVVVSGLRRRVAPSSNATIVGTWPINAEVAVRCWYEVSAEGDTWGSSEECFADNAVWSAIRLAGTDYMLKMDEPAATPITRFAKVGDSITAAHEFLYPCGEGRFNAGTYPDLAGTVSQYQESFIRESNLAISGWTTRDLQIALTRQDTEYDLWQPQVAFIQIGTNDLPEWLSSGFSRTNLRTIVRGTLERGILPVLMTIPANKNKPVAEYNLMIYGVAEEFDIEVLDYFTVMSSLPNSGLSEDGVHPSIPSDGETCTFNQSHLLYGMTARNWLIVQWLHEHS